MNKADVDQSLNEESENPVSNKAVATKINQITSQGGEPNTIETIKVNGSPLTPDGSKAVDISVPTNNNQLTNGAGYQTEEEVEGIVTSKGYQNASQVDSAILAKGYITGASVTEQLEQYAKKN